MTLFPFAQFELPGRLGLADGRYLVRDPEGDADDVVVVSSTFATRRGHRRRPRRARSAGGGPETPDLPAARITVVRATAFADFSEATGWLDRMRGDPEARDSFVAAGRALLNVCLHVHRAAAMDPYVTELGPEDASAIRIGFGSGDQLAGGDWTEALDAPPDPGRRSRRIDALRPQERLAAVLGGREEIDACETLLLRARLDLDHDRPREAALQLEPAVAAMLSELGGDPDPDQQQDLSLLRGRSEGLEKSRGEALAGALSEQSGAAVAETLTVCERILRRRRVLGR